MCRLLLCCVAGVTLAAAAWAQAVKDTQAAAVTRKKLQTKITVEFKDAKVVDCTKELKQLVEEAGGGAISFQFDVGVSMNLTITYVGKDKTLAEVLDGMFQKNGLGYIVVSNEKERYDGWIKIKQGKERGYPLGQAPAVKTPEKPKPEPEKPAKEKPAAKEKPPLPEGEKAEQMAAAKLSLAKELIDTGKTAKGKEWLEELLKMYPNTKAAAEAKKLLDKLKK
jgi:hypothetical protein